MNQAVLTENDVIAAVCAFLDASDFEIVQRLHTSQKGIDVIARSRRAGDILRVEAKGGTSVALVDDALHRRYVEPVRPALDTLEVGVLRAQGENDCTIESSWKLVVPGRDPLA
ncbi:MAG: hypothetical protein ACR2GT_03680 [Gaiellaceae bacterium]